MNAGDSPRRLALALLVALAGAALPALAADWYFDPVITAGVERNTNAVSSAERGESDDIGMVNARLMWTAATPRSKTEFTVDPTIERYRENTRLNNVSFATGIRWTADSSALTHWAGGIGWTRWERVRLLFDDPGAANVATPRSRYDSYDAHFGGTFQVGPRTHFDAMVRGRYTDYQNVVVRLFEDQDPVPVDPAKQYDATTGLTYAFSPLASGRLEYRGSRLDEGMFGERDIHRGLVSFIYGSAERWELRIAGGQAVTRAGDTGIYGDVEEPSETIGSLSFSSRIGVRGNITVGAVRDIGGSGGTLGASVIESAYAGWRQPVGTYSTVALLANVSRFNPIALVLEERETKTQAYRAEWAAAFNPRWYLVVAAERVDQTSDFIEGLSLDYTIYSVGMRWAPTATRQAVQQRQGS